MVVLFEITMLTPRWTKDKQKPFAFTWLLFKISSTSGIIFKKLSSHPCSMCFLFFLKSCHNTWLSWGRSRILIRWSKCQRFGRRWWQGLPFQLFARSFGQHSIYMWCFRMFWLVPDQVASIRYYLGLRITW